MTCRHLYDHHICMLKPLGGACNDECPPAGSVSERLIYHGIAYRHDWADRRMGEAEELFKSKEEEVP